MERAKLIIKETKRKKLVAEVCFEKDSKTMSVPKFTPKDTTLNGKIVQVERIKGQIVRILDGDHILFSTGGADISASKIEKKNMRESKTTKDSEKNFEEFKHIRDVRYPAHAPYNFVPLNSQVVSIPREEIPAFMEKENKRKFNTYWKDRKTGWIQLDIETKTPIYIRDTLNPKEMQIKQKSENDDKKKGIKKRYINSDFFSPGGSFQIPGSSLRGMVRNILEIVSFGKFENFDDQRLYYRGLADRSNLRTEYQQKMSSYDSKGRKPLYKANAGILKKDGMDYYITPTSYKPVSIEKREKGYKPFNFYKKREGYWIVSGDMPNKKRDWLILFPEDDTELIPISREDVKNYINDDARGKNVPNLIELAAIHEEVPCFYVTWKDELGKKRISFGHTVMFRLAYEKSTEEHIPVPAFQIDDSLIGRLDEADLSEESMKKIMELDKKKYTRKELMDKLETLNMTQRDINIIMTHASIIDLAEAIFGNEKTFAGRVFFENAHINEEHGNELNGESVPDILSSPKPTTFQHYLAQTSDEIRKLNHYNTPAPIRGFKLYWHKSGKQWEGKDKVKVKQILDSKKILNSLREIDEKVDSQHTVINPVKPGTQFTGKIRFENLSEIELGALLFAIDLPADHCHKLGMGKPLGLGSIQIRPTLYLSKRSKRYSSLFAEWGKSLEESFEQKDIEKFKAAFAAYITKEITPSNISNDLWQLDRIQELKCMLDFKNKPDNKETGYMKIEPDNEFKNRKILQSPTALISEQIKKKRNNE
jgi:CRISPR/Cas system CSM-associated protein Csm3 (group 7 of RAMP superfamily)